MPALDDQRRPTGWRRNRLPECRGKRDLEILVLIEQALNLACYFEHTIALATLDDVLELGEDLGIEDSRGARADAPADKPTGEVTHHSLHTGCNGGLLSSDLLTGKQLVKFRQTAEEVSPGFHSS